MSVTARRTRRRSAARSCKRRSVSGGNAVSALLTFSTPAHVYALYHECLHRGTDFLPVVNLRSAARLRSRRVYAQVYHAKSWRIAFAGLIVHQDDLRAQSVQG